MLTIALSFAAAAAPSPAQLEYAAEITDAVGQCAAMLARDIDGDSIIDVVAASSDDGALYLFRGLPGGAGFARREVLAVTGAFLVDAAATDFDGDGDMDFFTVRSLPGEVHYVENLGGGAFATPVLQVTLNQQGATVDAADVDADGDPDLVVAGLVAGVRFFPNVGGVLGSPQDLAPGARALVARFGDVDGDGRLDVLFGTYQDDRVAFCAGDGQGGFAVEQVIEAGLADVRDALVTDLDGDGRSDVLVALEFNMEFAWYRALGGGTFAPRQSLGAPPDRAFAVDVADVDGDGDRDVLDATYDGQAFWFENVGAGQFLGGVPIGDDRFFRNIEAADVDGDGDIDLMTAPFGRGARVRLNDGAGGFGEVVALGAPAFDVRSVEAADLDGDGDLDLLSASLEDDLVASYENLGGGVFGEQSVVGTAGNGPIVVRAGDIDGDGLVDVVAASVLDDRVVWYPRLSGGGHGPAQTIADLASDPRDMAVGDLDGDGDADVVVGRADNLAFQWYPNLGGGAFGAPNVLDPSGRRVHHLEIADIDADGVMDVAAMKWNTPYVFVYRGMGGGAFASGVAVTQYLDLPVDLHLADLDGDGLLDLLWNENPGLTWARNLGGAAFGPGTVIGDPFVENIETLDLDGDGDRDVVAVGFSENASWFENTPGGFVARGVASLNTSGVSDAAVGDLDGDGDEDLVTATSNGHRVDWFRNSAFGEVGQTDCGPAVPNSTGASASIAARGAGTAASNALSLLASDLPTGQFGMFLASRDAGFAIPFGSAGALCLGGAIGRFDAPGETGPASTAGTLALVVDPGAIATPGGSVAAMQGETWRFQAWFRDAVPLPTSNFTDSVAVTWQ